MAFRALSSPGFKGNLWMVPVGINYSHVTASQSIVTANVSTPVLLNEFYPAYKTNPTASFRSCAQFFYAILLQQVLHIENDRHQLLADRLLQLQRNNTTHQKNRTDMFRVEKKCCDHINSSSEKTIEEIEKKTSDYFNELQVRHITDPAVSEQVPMPAWKKIFLVMFSPLLIIGYLLNMPAIVLVKKIVDKKVYRQDFYSWIFVASSAILYLCWILLMAILILATAGWKWAASSIIFIPLTGWLTHTALLWLKEIRDDNKWKIFQKKNPSAASSLQKAG